MALEFGKIEKLYIQPCLDADCNEAFGEKFEALINPESYTYKCKIDFCETQAPGTSGVALKFNKIPPQDYSFDFLFDGTGVFKGASVLDVAIANPLASSKNVSDQVDDFKKKIFEYKSESHRPNYLKIVWGTLLKKGVLISMDIEYKLFKPDGTPIRAIAKCTFRGTVSEELRLVQENKKSSDITHERRITASDKLSLMTHRIYNNQNYYTDVAAFNRFDGFRKIQTGTKVHFPKIEK
jgi:hypothetical protein